MYDTAEFSALIFFYNLYRQASEKYMCKWILKVCDNGGRNIKLDPAEFTDIDWPTKKRFWVQNFGRALTVWLVG